MSQQPNLHGPERPSGHRVDAGARGGAAVCRYMHEGRPVSSFAVLRKVMEGNGFQLKAQEDMPFVIREHARKFQWGCAHGSVWVKT